MTCPNQCKSGDTLITFKMSEIDSHLQVCPLEPVKCELCSELVQRQNLESHLNQVTCSHFSGLRQENRDLKQQLAFLTKELFFLKSVIATSKNAPISPVVGLKLDIRDAVGKWCAAQVVEISGSDATIHFEGWESKWDEGVDFMIEPYRFARVGEIPRAGKNPYRLGQQVRARYLLNGASGQYRMEGGITAIDGVELQVNSRRWYHVLEVEPIHPATPSIQVSITSGASSQTSPPPQPDQKRREETDGKGENKSRSQNTSFPLENEVDLDGSNNEERLGGQNLGRTHTSGSSSQFLAQSESDISV